MEIQNFLQNGCGLPRRLTAPPGVATPTGSGAKQEADQHEVFEVARKPRVDDVVEMPDVQNPAGAVGNRQRAADQRRWSRPPIRRDNRDGVR
jgi:hypothetical protein